MQASQVKRRVFWRDFTQLTYITSEDPFFNLTGFKFKKGAKIRVEYIP